MSEPMSDVIAQGSTSLFDRILDPVSTVPESGIVGSTGALMCKLCSGYILFIVDGPRLNLLSHRGPFSAMGFGVIEVRLKNDLS